MSAQRGQLPATLDFSSVKDFLSLVRLPGRCCTWQGAAILGVETPHMPILVSERLLKPLGNPPPNAPKYYSTKYLLRLAEDERWLERASDALVKHWPARNAKKSKAKKISH